MGVENVMAGSKRRYYPNMDVMRYLLALGIILSHFKILLNEEPIPLVAYFRVGGFFAMSGFLVYPSFEKMTGLGKFAIQRAVRILPPYIFIVLLCAFGLSAISTLSAGEYFTSKVFGNYLLANLTFLNWLQPDLPGVFSGPGFVDSAVNGALWTMKVEWCLFLSVPAIFWGARKLHIGKRTICILIIIVSIVYRVILIWLFERTGAQIYEILSRQIFGQAAYYYTGILIYFYKDKFLRHLPAWLIIAVILSLFTLDIPFGLFTVAPIAMSIAILAISLSGFAPLKLSHRHNVSYEMYLFHFPIIQLGLHFGLHRLPDAAFFSIVLGATVLLSIFCHFAIELPIIDRFRSRFNSKENSAKTNVNSGETLQKQQKV